MVVRSCCGQGYWSEAGIPCVGPLPFAFSALILVKGFTSSVTSRSGGEAVKMRMTWMAAGLGIVLAACGGEKKTEDQQTTATPDQQSAPAASGPAAAAPAGGGATHDVNMVL